ncbi:hypothetical protein pdam_00011436 [Pocillopora damicornis]|uniref:Gustatory receptor n=2 Tax=Pocillopora damicornis TaxID=46731 RepID=A0A3M6URT7_POCDA|nr:hypothetical protein pdam_00011436 [Pocillopora damicornis]
MYGSIISFRPWNGFLVYRLNFFAFIFCSCFSWALPFSLFYVSCDLLLGIFEDLETKVKAGDPDASDIRWIRQEHRKLCVRVDLANKVFSHLLLAAVGLDVPLMCFNYHQLVKSNASTSSDFTYLVSLLYWSVCVVVKLAFILLAGVRVNEKIHSFYDILQSFTVPDNKGHLELLHFMMHLRGEPIGLSIGGFVVIDKSLVISLVGIIISYFAVLITLPS